MLARLRAASAPSLTPEDARPPDAVRGELYCLPTSFSGDGSGRRLPVRTVAPLPDQEHLWSSVSLSGKLIYAGVGSRQTPDEIQHLMRRLAVRLRQEGWMLRTGGSPGADFAFEGGATTMGDYSQAEVYLPWPGFGGIERPVALERPTDLALAFAARHHPAWGRLTPGARLLLGRNVHIITGPQVDAPVLSKFVLCWTEGGRGGGGTGHTARLAGSFGLPVRDLALPDVREAVGRWLG